MDNSCYNFSEIDSKESFAKLGTSLGTKSVNNLIQLPSESGEGMIRKIDFERGLHIRAWQLKLNHPFVLQRVAEKNAEPGTSFTIVYVLSNDAVSLHTASIRKDIVLHGNMNILLLANNIDIDFKFAAGNEVKAVDISLSSEWVKNQFSDADSHFEGFLDNMKNNIKPVVFIESGSSMEYRTVMDLHTHAFTGSKGKLYLKAKTLSLISDFLNRAFSHVPNELVDSNVLHQDKMLMVEKILDAHIEKDLPSIELIAKQAALSESTLKRHFKLMFGKSIYEYYLEKKMEHAKRLLLEKPLTVKEVAYRLGYEKTSNFIHIFKKFHTYSPGYMKKNIAF